MAQLLITLARKQARVFAAAALILVASLPAAAKDYVLALSWQPAFCDSQAGRGKIECRTPTATPLVLHGLWPQTGEYCGAADQRSRRWERLPALALSAETRRRMDIFFPGTASHLDRHQWAKHGSCSGLAPEAYFRTALAMTEAANRMAFGQLLIAHAGRDLPAGELCRALAQDFGPGFAAATILRSQHGALTELRFLLSDETGPLALARENLSRGRKALRCDGSIHLAPAR